MEIVLPAAHLLWGLIGKHWLHKVTMRVVQMVTGALLLGIAVCLMAGMI